MDRSTVTRLLRDYVNHNDLNSSDHGIINRDIKLTVLFNIKKGDILSWGNIQFYLDEHMIDV